MRLLSFIAIFLGEQTTMSTSDPRLVLDLPTEIIQNVVFKYLTCTDIESLTMIGNKRLKEISKDYLKRTSKFLLELIILIIR